MDDTFVTYKHSGGYTPVDPVRAHWRNGPHANRDRTPGCSILCIQPDDLEIEKACLIEALDEDAERLINKTAKPWKQLAMLNRMEKLNKRNPNSLKGNEGKRLAEAQAFTDRAEAMDESVSEILDNIDGLTDVSQIYDGSVIVRLYDIYGEI